METLHPTEIELGLERIKIVASRLGLLVKQPATKIITVAGTNGKGSFAASLEALLLQAGQTVGTYTSPHIINYNERIRVNGCDTTDILLCRAFEDIDAIRQTVSLTYFEFATLAALRIFAQAELDYWVLEVGLGGRLDAVNILDPNIAVVTSISIDHEKWLGSTRESIGAEKAGIFRPNGCVICADENPPTTIIDKMQELNTASYFLGQQFGYEAKPGDLTMFVSLQSTSDKTSELANPANRIELSKLPQPELPLPSVAAALQAMTLLGFVPQSETIAKSLLNLSLAGRFQRIAINQYHHLIFDVAHNPASMLYLAGKLKQLREQGVKHIETVFTMMADKNMAGSLAHLLPFVDCWCPVTLTDSSRAANTKELTDVLQKLGVAGECIKSFPSTEDALRYNLESGIDASKQLRITLVTGSFYVVGEASSFMRDWQPRACEDI